jgi:hypothetical protein
MERICITRADGGVSIMEIADKANLAEEIALWSDLAAPGEEYVSHVLIDSKDLPERTFRNAWTHDGEAVVVDMVKAREILTDKLAQTRQEVINSLPAMIDAAFMRGENTSPLKHRLRELQRMNLVEFRNKVHRARTPQDLLAVWPRDLLPEMD